MQSKLHRKLQTNGQPIFTAKIDDITITDNLITHITTTHGGSQYGYTPATAEIGILNANPNLLDSTLTISLNPWFTTKINRNWGKDYSDAAIAPMFTGRIGIVEVEDKSDTKRITKINASSWGSLLPGNTAGLYLLKGSNIGYQLRRFFSIPALNGRIPGSYIGDQFETVAQSETIAFNEVMSKYAEPLGIHCRQERRGWVTLHPINRRIKELTDLNASRPAFLRSQVLSPATWKQPLALRGTNLKVTRYPAGATSPITGPYTSTFTEEGKTYLMQGEKTLDLSAMAYTQEESWERPARAMNYRENYPRAGLEAIQVDMLHLLTSPRAVDRRLGPYILGLEEGQPVFFSGDWPTTIRFPMIATKITHTITPDSWRCSIDLDHVRNHLGLANTELPEYTPKIWEQFASTWDSTEGTWNQ